AQDEESDVEMEWERVQVEHQAFDLRVQQGLAEGRDRRTGWWVQMRALGKRLDAGKDVLMQRVGDAGLAHRNDGWHERITDLARVNPLEKHEIEQDSARAVELLVDPGQLLVHKDEDDAAWALVDPTFGTAWALQEEGMASSTSFELPTGISRSKPSDLGMVQT